MSKQSVCQACSRVKKKNRGPIQTQSGLLSFIPSSTLQSYLCLVNSSVENHLRSHNWSSQIIWLSQPILIINYNRKNLFSRIHFIFHLYKQVNMYQTNFWAFGLWTCIFINDKSFGEWNKRLPNQMQELHVLKYGHLTFWVLTKHPNDCQERVIWIIAALWICHGSISSLA